MNLHSSTIKTCALITLGFAIISPITQVAAQETKPTDTQPPVAQHSDVKTTKSSDPQKTKPKIAPLPLTRPVELGDRPTRTLNRFAPAPSAETVNTKVIEANSPEVKDCSASEGKRKVSKSKKATASKKTNKLKNC